MPPADLVLTGGRVLTEAALTAAGQDNHGRHGSPVDTGEAVTAVALAAGRVVALGPDVDAAMGPGTRVVDLAGGLLVPGFQDAHVHPVQGGRERLSCDLSDQDSLAGHRRTVADFAGRRPDLTWVTGGGWMLAAFPGGLPRREALDDMVEDRPVMLLNRDHHGAWVNSLALRLAGVTRETADPPDGRIERDPDGSPTGMLHEGAMDLVGRLVPEPTLAEQVAALLEAQRYLHSFGITAWQDAILGSYGNITDASAAYAACADDHSLTARVVGALWWDRSRAEEQVAELVERRRRWTRERFRPTAVKIMQDGIVENFTAGLLTPYLDGHGGTTDRTGLSMMDPQALKAHVTSLDGAGFQVHVHAIGDRAVRETLDAFAAAEAANGSRDRRHHIAHLQVIHPDDVGRFAALDVTANLQPLWATHEEQMDELTLPFLPAETAARQYPFGSLARAGARLAAGSDWPVSSPDPLWGIHVAVNRQLPPMAGPVTAPFLLGERLSVGAALRAYTAGSAYLNRLEDAAAIRVGGRADFALLDTDILSCPESEIGATEVLATYVDGVEVFAR